MKPWMGVIALVGFVGFFMGCSGCTDPPPDPLVDCIKAVRVVERSEVSKVKGELEAAIKRSGPTVSGSTEVSEVLKETFGQIGCREENSIRNCFASRGGLSLQQLDCQTPPPPPSPSSLKWRCEPPTGLVAADCELGGLGGKNQGRKGISSYGTLKTDTFCQHDGANTGYAQVASECDPVMAGGVASLSMAARAQLYGKAGFTGSDDCRGDGGSRDKCWTRAEYDFDARASLIVPPTGAFELQVDAFRCPKDFATLSGPDLKLEEGARHRLQGGEVLTLRLKGGHLLDTTDTKGKTYQRECTVRLSVVPVAR